MKERERKDLSSITSQNEGSMKTSSKLAELNANRMALNGKLASWEQNEDARDLMANIPEQQTLEDRQQEGTRLTRTSGG